MTTPPTTPLSPEREKEIRDLAYKVASNIKTGMPFDYGEGKLVTIPMTEEAMAKEIVAALRSVVEPVEEQRRLGWERAAEKDRAYGDMIKQRDVLERKLAEVERERNEYRNTLLFVRDFFNDHIHPKDNHPVTVVEDVLARHAESKGQP